MEKNSLLDIIIVAASERDVSKKYTQQLNKLIRAEDSLVNTLSDEQLELYRALDHEVGELHLIDNYETVDFTLKLLSNIIKKWTTNCSSFFMFPCLICV